MTIESVQKLILTLRAVELVQGKQYLIQVPEDIHMSMMNDLIHYLKLRGLQAILVKGDVTFYEIQGEEPQRDGKLTITRTGP